MKNVELTGTKRAISGTTGAKEIRRNKQVPCVLYGGQEVLHFSVDERALGKIVNSPDAFSIELNIDGEKRTALLHDKQFQPLTDAIIHADFLETVANKEAKVSMNVRLKGQSAGVRKGGKMTQSLRRLRVKGMADKLPEIIELDVTDLDLGGSINVKDIKIPGMTILEKPSDVVVSVKMPKKVETPAETAAAAGTPAAAATPAAATDKKAEPAKK
ncbi:MAG: 50S ribosomal protein L25 [Flavobacteriales bacterium]